MRGRALSPGAVMLSRKHFKMHLLGIHASTQVSCPRRLVLDGTHELPGAQYEEVVLLMTFEQ